MRGLNPALLASSATPITITLNNVYASGTATLGSFFSVTAITNSIVATISGGIPPYSYTWSKVSGDDVTLTDLGNTAYWSVTSTFPIIYNAIWKLNAVDSIGNSADSLNITVNLEIDA